jgi:hypothetical protein
MWGFQSATVTVLTPGRKPLAIQGFMKQENQLKTLKGKKKMTFAHH